MRTLLTLTVGLIVSLATAATASADVPPASPAPIVVGTDALSIEYDSQMCGSFPVHVQIDARVSFRYLETADGPFANVFHATIDYSYGANGKTVVGRQRYTDRFPMVDAELRESGLTVSIRLAGGGLVIRDAGRFVMQLDGTVTLVRGPHPVLEAGGVPAAIAEICAALV